MTPEAPDSAKRNRHPFSGTRPGRRLAHFPGSGTRPGLIPVLLGLILGAPAATGASEPPSADASEPASATTPAHPALFDRVEEFRLDNGMLFLLLPRHEVPTVSGRICFRVGNADSPSGATGLAHMFEHMAFKGTDKIGTRDIRAELAVEDSVSAAGSALAREVAKGPRADTVRVSFLRAGLERVQERQEALTVPNEWPQLYDRYTFDFNAYTTPDFTVYTAELPANNLEVWMLMESERIQHPSFREFYREREVVSEERRQSTEDNPETMATELLYALAFTAHPYRYPVIGYRSDIETLTQSEAEAFRKTYYVPGNAVGVLVGDFDPAAAKKMIQDYFGDIPAGPPPPEIPTVEPEQKGIRRGTHMQGTEKELLVGFHAPAPADPRAVVAQVLADVLARDNTSRLRKRLIIREKAARTVTVSPDGGFSRYPGLFEIEAMPMPGISNERLETLLWSELEGLATRPVTEAKLKEIQSSYRKRSYRELERNSDLASALLHNQETYGDWRRCYLSLDMADAVTPAQVTALAREIFRKDNATVVYLEPEKAPGAAHPGGEGGR